MKLKENEKQCPQCKNKIPKDATVCPICKNDLSVAGNVGTIFKGVGCLIIMICIAIPLVMFVCGMCSS